MEEDPRDGRAVAGQRVLLRRPRDPLARRPLFPRRRPRNVLLLRLGQFRLQLVYLAKEKGQVIISTVEKTEANLRYGSAIFQFSFSVIYGRKENDKSTKLTQMTHLSLVVKRPNYSTLIPMQENIQGDQSGGEPGLG